MTSSSVRPSSARRKRPQALLRLPFHLCNLCRSGLVTPNNPFRLLMVIAICDLVPCSGLSAPSMTRYKSIGVCQNISKKSSPKAVHHFTWHKRRGDGPFHSCTHPNQKGRHVVWAPSTTGWRWTLFAIYTQKILRSN